MCSSDLPVIERLNLQKAWAAETELPLSLAARRLKNSLSVRRFRDTSLIEVVVTDTDPRLAAQIANALADVFEKDRLEVKRDETLKGINKLREELDAQWQRVQEAQDKVERLRKELNVPVIGTVRLSDYTLQQLDQQLTTAKVEAAAREAKLNELKKLTPLQLRNTIATLINDPNVSSLLQSLTESELRMEVLKQDYGPEHPNVRAEQASLDKLREQMDARLAGVIAGFEIEYQTAQRRVDDLQKQLDAAKAQTMLMESATYRPFRNAQLIEDQETKLYDALKQRLQQESVTVDLPRSPVEVVEHAEPPLFPVSPRMTLNLILGGVAGLVLGIVMAFFLEFLDTSIKKVEDVEHYLGLRFNESRHSDGGNEDVGRPADAREILTAGVADGDGGVGILRFRRENQRDRSPHNPAATDDDHVGTLDLHTTADEQFVDAGWRTRCKAGQVAQSKFTDVQRMKTINVLGWVDSREDRVLGNLRRQW